MASKRAFSFPDEADRILGERKRSRNKVACYPCNKRKVKCDTGQPCAMCVRRGHPVICTYPADRVWDTTPGHVTVSVEQLRPGSKREVTRAPPFLGLESTTAYMQRLATETGSEVAQDVSPALALGGVLSWNPFQRYHERDSGFLELTKILPGRESVQRYYHLYRSTVHPLSPLIDIEPLDLKIADYLEDSITIMSDVTSAATIALILAILASGAQYSDLVQSERRRISRDFASKSFRALHLANYLIRPTAPCLQTLLLLGSFIRNDGDANASWALLGTTMRLAQSVGLHDAENIQSLSASDKRMRSQLWKTVLQHDSILSLCFDRPTSLPTLPLSNLPSSTPAEVLDYSQMMWGITRLCVGNLMHLAREINLSRIHQSLRQVDNLITQSSPHLQTRTACLSMQDRLEHYTINLHMSFLVSVICRPVFLASDNENHQECMALNTRGRAALSNTVRHFLNLQKLTTYAIRTWTTLHEALSSALLLELLHESDKNAETRIMQKQFLEVVIPTLDNGSDRDTGLSMPHTRAIAALRKIATRQTQPNPATLVPMGSGSSTQPVPDPSNIATLPDLIPTTFDQSTLDSFDSILWGMFHLLVQFPYMDITNHDAFRYRADVP
ncbi:hypothetical protein BU25DRAFT_135212 [Macroventuria anomochaeta]|uniref:Uncharacterized protein n=1 Tax=Macroventuria anomochaeta TaxID=301207 RepID=A0ACB6SFJ3_9PLEO|nr:uncharacterized protein BU25DRAFT_135212 [Macroventuria anomochaeta]KAF2631867.1 hypothetical protein BU25DRAFT_135212 [Macroventuria anomochaeta]